MKKLLILSGIVSLCSLLFSCFVYLNFNPNYVPFSNKIFEVLHNLNVMLIFPLSLIITRFLYKKLKGINTKKNDLIIDSFFVCFFFVFFQLIYIIIINFDFCKIEEVKTLYVNTQNSNSIVFRESRCGIVGIDSDLIELKTKHYLIFIKYEEIDTCSIELTNWKKINE